jgi:hypothetical protein
MIRVCRTCGREHRGLVCRFCHPRGSGEKAQLARDLASHNQHTTGQDDGAAELREAGKESRSEAGESHAG